MKTLLFSFLSLIVAPSVFAQSATVTWTTTYQTIDGWGASTGYEERNPNLTSSQADMFFSPTAGIGLEWIRIQDSQDGTSTPDLPTLQLAVSRGAKVLISFDFSDGSQYSSITSYIKTKLDYLSSQGIPVAVLSPDNEPSNDSSWTAENFQILIRDYLGPAVGLGSSYNIPFAMPEWETQWANPGAPDFSYACMGDANCSKYVVYAAEHGYATWPFSTIHFAAVPSYFGPIPGPIHVWQTEVNDSLSKTYTCSTGNPPWDPSIADAVAWAENIHEFLVNQNGSAWMYWNLQSKVTNPSCNDGLTDGNFDPAQRFYAVGNWSKFVRPGWLRMDATVNPAPGILVTAFKEASSGNFAIVAINQNSSPASVNFSLSAFPPVTAVTPTLTSANVNLVDQPSVSASSAAFSYSLPASSVTTFHGNASFTSASKPNPPTSLVLAVQ